MVCVVAPLIVSDPFPSTTTLFVADINTMVNFLPDRLFESYALAAVGRFIVTTPPDASTKIVPSVNAAEVVVVTVLILLDVDIVFADLV